VRHSWLARIPVTTDEQRSAYDPIYDVVRQGQHDHMLIGRRAVQHSQPSVVGAVRFARGGTMGTTALIALIRSPQVCSPKILTCEQQ